MKLIQINTVCNGSTGKIMGDIQRKAQSEGWECLSIYGRRKGYKDIPCKKFGNFFSFWFHVFLTTVFDLQGHGSYFETKRMIKEIKKQNPDVIHLHNIHGYYLHIPTLFKYLKNEYKGKICWTLHDCWTFTGHCPHFILANCNKWKTQCNKCPNKKLYPISLFIDRSRKNYLEKKELFTGLKNVTIITPSEWLKNLVKQSFLKDYKVCTINNGIDLNTFKLIKDDNIKKKYFIPNDKKIILGVANVWGKTKGLEDFINLSKQLPEDFVIVLVGLNNKQIKNMKAYKNIIGIKRTENQEDLAKIYSIADVFINPSKEETFSMVAVEALACKTPVIVYSKTPMVEFVNDKNGLVVEKNTITVEDIIKVMNKKDYYFEDIINYDKKVMSDKILEMYNR